MAEEIFLRPATLADARRLAHLWLITFPDKFGAALGKNAEAVLRDWLRLSQRHLQTTTIAQVKGTVAGFVVLETPDAPPPDDGRWLWQALQWHHGFLGACRGLILMWLMNHPHSAGCDEVYIEMLGVAPAWRKQGVAYHLMNHAEAIARMHQVKQLRLTVVSKNIPAIHLYQKLGFTVQTEHHSRLLRWITGHRSYYEMSKPVIHSDKG